MCRPESNHGAQKIGSFAQRADFDGYSVSYSRKTDRSEYTLIKQVNAIGSQEGSAIRLTGWFGPKTVATIARLGRSYSIIHSQNTKPLLINGIQVVGQRDLKDGDHIEVAGVTLRFSLSSETNDTTC
jgi:hypothetical protein